MSNKLASDSDLRDALAAFFVGAEGDEGLQSNADGSPLRLFTHGERQLMIRKGVAFSLGPATTKAHNAVVQRCGKLLGAVASNEEDISDLIWDLAAARVATVPRPEIVDSTVAAVTQINDQAARYFAYVDCNHLMRFAEGVDRVVIGPVTGIRTGVLANEIERHPDAKWKIAAGDAPGLVVHDAGTVDFVLTPLAWSVQTVAARRNVLEHGLWLIDIATSLLRLSYQVTGPHYPSIGEREAHPVQPSAAGSSSILIAGFDMRQGGNPLPGLYEVDASLVTMTEAETFKRRADLLFGAKGGSVGERVAQGLGWLTRGRRAGDRAERLLYAFTAMEALLSSDDKSAPIVQTIARHAAVMLWTVPEDRESGARKIRDLYTQRSALVHSGARRVSKTDADTVQYFAELLFWQTLDKVALESKLESFHSGLSAASYGGPWPATP